MRVVLQSNDKFNEFGEFDPETGSLTIRPKNDSPVKGGVSGWYGTIGDSVAFLFHLDHRLHFAYRDQRFSLQDDAQARVEGGQTARRFTLEQGGKTLICIDYEIPPPVVPPELDFTDTRPEDFDFLLFVRNVLKNPERRKLAQGFPRR